MQGEDARCAVPWRAHPDASGAVAGSVHGSSGEINRSRDATVEPGDTTWPHRKRWFPREPAPRSAVSGKPFIQTYRRRSNLGGKAGFTALIGPCHRAGWVRQPTPGRRLAPQIRRRIRRAPRIRERSGTNHLLAGAPEGPPGTRLKTAAPAQGGNGAFVERQGGAQAYRTPRTGGEIPVRESTATAGPRTP